MRRTLTLVALLLGVSLLACTCPDDDDYRPPPAIQTDPCTDEHDMAFVEAENGTHIRYETADGEILPAQTTCNSTIWYVGGSAQSGDTFHFTPWLVIPRSTDEFNLTWAVYDLEGNEVAGQALEVFDRSWEYDPFDGNSQGVPTEIFIGPDQRGKNLHLVATLDNITTQEVVSAEARIHLATQASE